MGDVYVAISERTSQLVTQRYSTSFSMAASLFGANIRQDIYNIYGMVRIADEIVDTYAGTDAEAVLDAFEAQLYEDLRRGFSTNPVLQAFISTARKVGITKSLIGPFFASMRMDVQPHTYSPRMYQKYIYGSAEVVGLMCLKVFCQGDAAHYHDLRAGAQALGAAFQKVNFLRDLADDHDKLGRYYFPVGSFETFNEDIKAQIIADITLDFETARAAIDKLPSGAQKAVRAAYVYYASLLQRIEQTPAEVLKQQRIRVNDFQKLWLLVKVKSGLL